MKYPRVNTVYFFGFLSIHCLNVFVASIKIEVTNQYSEDLAHVSLNIKCLVEKRGNCRKTDIVLQLSKNDEKRIVSIQGQDKIEYGRIPKQSVRAEGHIDGDDVSNSYLSVTIDNVMREDSGVYICSVFYLDDFGHMQDEQARKNITIQNQNAEDVVRYILARLSKVENMEKSQQTPKQNQILELQKKQELLQQRVTDLEKNVQEQSDVIRSQRRQLNAQRDYIQKRVSSKLDDLLENDRNQSQSIQDLVEKDSYKLAFSYGYSPDNPIENNQTMIFSVPILNLTNAYNPQDGLFTAPRDGLYVFHVMLVTEDPGDVMGIQILANDEIQASLFSWDAIHEVQTSISTVVALNKGDIVRPFVPATSNKHVNWKRHFSVFSGYLLKPF